MRGVLTVSTSEGMLRQKVVDQLSMRSPAAGKKVPDEAAMALLEREKTGPALGGLPSPRGFSIPGLESVGAREVV